MSSSCEFCGSRVRHTYSDERGDFGPIECWNDECPGADGQACPSCGERYHLDEIHHCECCGEFVCEDCLVDKYFCCQDCSEHYEKEGADDTAT